MRSRLARIILLSLALAPLAACGSTEPISPVTAELARLVPCNPLQNDELTASLAQPLAVARTRSGVLYAVSQVGPETVLWRSLDQQLIAYRLLQQSSALDATIFGVDDGWDGFALTLRPESAPTSVRLFRSLAEAQPRAPSGTTTAGSLLEMLPKEALQGFRAATEISPALLVGAARASRADGLLLPEDVLLVRTSLERTAPIAVFNERDGVLRQQRVTDSVQRSDGSLDLEFELYGEPASVHVDAPLTTDDGVGPKRGQTPALLAQLEFRCAPALPRDWALPGERVRLPAASCSPPRATVHTCLDAHSRRPAVALAALDWTEAQVTEAGRGVPPTGRCATWLPEESGAPRELLWAHIEHASGEAWLGLSTPEAAQPFEVGETLSLRASEDPPFRGNITHIELELRSSNGALLFWRGRANSLSLLRRIPEFEFSLGPERCRDDSSIGYTAGTAQYELDSWRIDAEATLIGSGAWTRQGPFRVENAGLLRVFGSTEATEPIVLPPGAVELAVWRSPGG